MLTATSYMDEGLTNSKESYEASASPRGSMLNLQQRPAFHQSGIMFMRTGIVSDSEDEDEDIIKDFRRKFHKQDL